MKFLEKLVYWVGFRVSALCLAIFAVTDLLLMMGVASAAPAIEVICFVYTILLIGVCYFLGKEDKRLDWF